MNSLGSIIIDLNNFICTIKTDNKIKKMMP